MNKRKCGVTHLTSSLNVLETCRELLVVVVVVVSRKHHHHGSIEKVFTLDEPQLREISIVPM